MTDVKKVVLTGGPCAGKTSILHILESEFGNKIVFVPEVATLLLDGGFPVPGKHLSFSEEWQIAFEGAILPLQKTLEDAYVLVAQHKKRVLICDRGLFDVMAYTQWDLHQFCQNFGFDCEREMARYSMILHLESLATAAPADYGHKGNKSRFEPLERARILELSVRRSWQEHPQRVFIAGAVIEEKISKVRKIVSDLIAELD